jgi:hypothetical protein
MAKYTFLFQLWGDAYKELKSERTTLNFLRTTYEDEIDSKELEKQLKSLETWVPYAVQHKLLYHVTALNDNEEPYAWINFNEGSCYVEFLDEYYRTFMRYSFQISENEHNKLFLYKMDFWRYTSGDDKAESYQNCDLKGSYNFTPEGGLIVYTNKKDFLSGKWEEEVQEAAHPVNVEKNWEPYPDWTKKNYEGLVKLKRWEEGDFLKGIPNYYE